VSDAAPARVLFLPDFGDRFGVIVPATLGPVAERWLARVLKMSPPKPPEAS
jgi:hypothetical protein